MQRAAGRESARRRRAKRRTAGVEPAETNRRALLPRAIRLRSVDDALALLEVQVGTVASAEVPVLERGRCTCCSPSSVLGLQIQPTPRSRGGFRRHATFARRRLLY